MFNQFSRCSISVSAWFLVMGTIWASVAHTEIDQGTIFRRNQHGTIIEQVHAAEAALLQPNAKQLTPTLSCKPQWRGPFQVALPGYSDHLKPLFYENNAFVLSTRRGFPTALDVHLSQGHNKEWSTESVATPWYWLPRRVIDLTGNITVTAIAGGYGAPIQNVYATRYLPGKGWSNTELIYTSNYHSLHNSDLGADAAGNVIHVFVQHTIGSFQGEVWSQIYNAKTEQWEPATQVTLNGNYTTVLQSPDRKQIYLAYYALSPTPGIFLQKFNSADLSWGEAQFVPGSERATPSSSQGPGTLVTGTVDDGGNITLLWEDAFGSRRWIVVGTRYENKIWQEPVRLVDEGSELMLGEFSHEMNVNAQGDAIGVTSQYRGGIVTLYTIMYKAGIGWQVDSHVNQPFGITSRTRASFFGEQRQYAVAFIYISPPGGGPRVPHAVIYDGVKWSAAEQIPGHSFRPYDLVADGDELLFVSVSDNTGEALGSWLRCR